MNENLTDAVIETMESDREMNRECRRIARLVVADGTDDTPWQAAERIGTGICVWIGERLSGRFDGAVPRGGVHDTLWMTFISQVSWHDVGRFYLNIHKQKGQSS